MILSIARKFISMPRSWRNIALANLCFVLVGCGGPSFTIVDTNISDRKFDKYIGLSTWIQNNKIIEDGIIKHLESNGFVELREFKSYLEESGAICRIEGNLRCELKKYRRYVIYPDVSNGSKFYNQWIIIVNIDKNRKITVSVSQVGMNG
ncbi:hypothetical protein [Bosea sp. LC85]|uniref:hypothetical protein n=1 Tax=Bosea sp. LC85 TaxID=1502851 RepID=UPI00126A7A58|nr:hypothetical protein [Bosea sp. LC85]